MIDKLYYCIAEILEISIEELKESKTFEDFEKFDSLAVIQIAAVLDTEFNITIEPEQFEFLDSLDSIIDLTGIK